MAMNMPHIEQRVTLGNVLSISTGFVTIIAVIVGWAWLSATQQNDIDLLKEMQKSLVAEVKELKVSATVRSAEDAKRNERTVELLTEVRTQMGWVTNAIARLERLGDRWESITNER